MAETEYKPGDIIQGPCEPIIQFVNPENVGKCCNFCLKERGGLKLCTGCRKVFYCNAECQLKDWNLAHKTECKSPCFRDYCGAGVNAPAKQCIFRMFAALHQNPGLATKPFKMYNGTERSFTDLVSHVEEELEMGPLVRETIFIQSNLMVEGIDISFTRLIQLFSIYKTNSFQLLNATESKKLGSGLYIEQSVFDHSCKPNAFFCTYGGTGMTVRAIAPIAKGEKICISYLATHRPKQERQQILLERYRFNCHCEKCETESDANVDYDKLNMLIRNLEANKAIGTFAYKDVMKSHNEIMEYLRKIYHEYDERIANQYSRFFTGIAHTRQFLELEQKEYEQLMNEIRDHIRTTFGPGHHEFKYFVSGSVLCEHKRNQGTRPPRPRPTSRRINL